MHKKLRAYKKIAGNTFETHLNDAQHLTDVYPDEVFEELIKQTILLNKPIRKNDLLDLEKSHSLIISHVVSSFSNESDISNLKNLYESEYISTAARIENLKLFTRQWNENKPSIIEMLNPYEEQYVSNKLDLLAKTAQIDALIYIRKDTPNDEKENYIPIIDPVFFYRIDPNAHKL